MTEGPNAAVVRRGYEAFARRDVEAWLAGFHPDAELVELADHHVRVARVCGYRDEAHARAAAGL